VIPIPANIAYLTVPPLLGIMFNWGLYGALTVQTYIYSQSFPNDNKVIKVIVYGLFVLETVGTALATGDALQWFSIGYGDMLALSKPWYSAMDGPVIDAVISLTVQLFFSWRIWVLGKSLPLSIVISLVSLAQAVGSIVSGVRIQILDDVTKMKTVEGPLILWFSASALADLMIALSMIYFLTRLSSDQFSTGDIVRRIVRLTIETNSVTAIVAVVGFIMAVVNPKSSLVMLPAYVLGKLYTNTLLVVFNNRIFLCNQGLTARGTRSEDLSRYSRGGRRTLPTSTGRSTTNTGLDEFKIQIFQETTVATDGEMQLKELDGGKVQSDDRGSTI